MWAVSSKKNVTAEETETLETIRGLIVEKIETET